MVDSQAIESERETLSALFLQLKEAQQLADVADEIRFNVPISDASDIWDELWLDKTPTDNTSDNTQVTQDSASYRPADSAPNSSSSASSSHPIEDHIIAFPSNGFANSAFRDLELAHRISRADDLLIHIRNLVVEKSFQFSHVIRVSPRKGVTTRARATIKKLNNEIADLGRMYSRCRSCILLLSEDLSVSSRFKALLPADVAGSTAILNPNEPGSTTIKLSWIWQTSSRHLVGFADANDEVDTYAGERAETPASLLECMFFSFPFISY